MTLKRDKDGWPKPIGEVLIEEERKHRLGWAVYTGCEGEEAYFHAFFARRETAERYLAVCQRDPDSDEYLCDPDIAPAAVVDGCIIAANHFDLKLGAEAMIKASDALFEVEDFRKEATATTAIHTDTTKDALSKDE